nr:MAG TPA: hypothetical protein [Caudoviricetes sp.]
MQLLQRSLMQLRYRFRSPEAETLHFFWKVPLSA